MISVQDLITSSLRLIGVTPAGQTPSDSELADALDVLNAMLEAWNAVRLAIYTIASRTFTLTGGTGSYSVGTGGAINVPRPVKIDSAGIVQSNGLRSELDILTSVEYAEIPEKSAQAIQPLKIYNDNDFPLTRFWLWPVPKVTCTLDWQSWESLEEPLSLGQDLEFPPAYWKAIRYNLAVDLAMEWGRPIEDKVLAIATSTKNDLFGLNASNAQATEDPPAAPAPATK